MWEENPRKWFQGKPSQSSGRDWKPNSHSVPWRGFELGSQRWKVRQDTTTQTCVILMTLDPIGNCPRPVFSHGVSQHMHELTNLWKFGLNRSSKLRDNNERKNTLVTQSCVRLDGWFRLKTNSWKITSFSKTTPLQRELFLTMFYTANLSPLLATK